MHDLIPLPPAGALVTYEHEHDALRTFAENEKAASTRRAYRSDCRERGLCPLPAHPHAVGWHISSVACDGLAVSSIGRRLAAIAYAHELAGHESPTSSKAVKVVLAGIRRTVGTAPKRKAAATADKIKAMLDCCPDTMIGIRDRALLALGFAGAFRHSELVALTIDDLELMDDGYRVTIRRSKTDQTGEGQVIRFPAVIASAPWRPSRRGYRPPASPRAHPSVPSTAAALCVPGGCPGMRWRRWSSSAPSRLGWTRQSSAAIRCVRAS
jgi:integrase